METEDALQQPFSYSPPPRQELGNQRWVEGRPQIFFDGVFTTIPRRDSYSIRGGSSDVPQTIQSPPIQAPLLTSPTNIVDQRLHISPGYSPESDDLESKETDPISLEMDSLSESTPPQPSYQDRQSSQPESPPWLRKRPRPTGIGTDRACSDDDPLNVRFCSTD